MKNNYLKASSSLLWGIGSATLALLVISIPLITNAQVLNRQLDLEMTGSDVTSLQTFLAKDATLYPQGLVTGYFGFLTKAAVSNFQSRNGIPAVGRVGPMTLPVLNLQMAQGMVQGPNYGSDKVAVITSVSVNSNDNDAVVSWNTDEPAKGVVYYNTNPLVITEQLRSVSVFNASTAMTDINFKNTQSVVVNNLSPKTTYYYMVHTTDQSGNVSVTWPGTFRTTN